MSYILSLSAEEIEKRLLKAASKIYSAEYIESDSLILVRTDDTHLIEDGSELKFRAPVACTDATRLRVVYAGKKEDTYKNFVFADANGNDIGEINNLFAENAVVTVILDFTANVDGEDTGAAFVQNADTNAYLEERFEELSKSIDTVNEVITSTEEYFNAEITNIRKDIDNAAVTAVQIITWEADDTGSD